MPNPFLHSIYVGQPKTLSDARGAWTSSICRERVDGPVVLTPEGLAGDRVAQPYHGGPDCAVCVHLMDHFRFWQERYGVGLQPGSVGENVVLEGIGEDRVCVGDFVRTGSALVQVSGPRVPCANLARRVGRPEWVKWTIRENRTGFFLRVIEPGMVQAGDAWELQERPNPDGAIPAINRCMYLDFDPAFARRIIGMAGIAGWWKEQLAEKLEKRSGHWTLTMKD